MCIRDRSSTEGGVDIEAVAKKNPEKIITTKVDLRLNLSPEEIKNILQIYQLDNYLALYRMPLFRRHQDK